MGAGRTPSTRADDHRSFPLEAENYKTPKRVSKDVVP